MQSLGMCVYNAECRQSYSYSRIARLVNGYITTINCEPNRYVSQSGSHFFIFTAIAKKYTIQIGLSVTDQKLKNLQKTDLSKFADTIYVVIVNSYIIYQTFNLPRHPHKKIKSVANCQFTKGWPFEIMNMYM